MLIIYYLRLALRVRQTEYAKSPTSDREAKLAQGRDRLMARLQTFTDCLEEVADTFKPSFPCDIREVTRAHSVAEDLPIKLPSYILAHLPALKRSIARDDSVFSTLLHIELQLREAHASSSLESLRHFLGYRSFLYTDKHENSTGQKTGAMATRTISAAQKKVDCHANVYRSCRQALVHLGMPEDDIRFQPLLATDLRPLKLSKKEHTLRLALNLEDDASWIWKVPGARFVDAEGNISDAWFDEGISYFCLFFTYHSLTLVPYFYSRPNPMARGSCKA